MLSSETISFGHDIFAASVDSINLCKVIQVATRVFPPATQLIRLSMQVQEKQHGACTVLWLLMLLKSALLHVNFGVITQILGQLKKFTGMQAY